MRSFRPRIQTGRAPGSNRASLGFKPGEPRIQTGRAPDSNRASPGIKPGEPRDQTRRAPGKGLSNLSKVSNAGGREKSVKSVSFVRFALSVEGVPSLRSVSATGLVSRHRSEFDTSHPC